LFNLALHILSKCDSELLYLLLNKTFLNYNNMTSELNNNSIDNIRKHQDFSFALIGGSLTALLCAVLWAVITIAMERQIGFMAIGLGFIVGYAVQFFGAGIDPKFGYLGAGLSLLGCVIGNLFCQVGFIANAESVSYLEVLSYLNLTLTMDIIVDTFQPMDLLFYGFAIYEGYRFAFRKFSEEELQKAQSDNASDDAMPKHSKLRMPLAIASLLLLFAAFLMLSRDVNGIKTYKNESGKKTSEGEMINGKEEGPWTFWYANGQIQTKGFFINGQPDSLWEWFDESGKIYKTGAYKKGLENGLWLSYHENGALRDSGRYHESRMVDLWKSWYENGNLSQMGAYKRNLQDGLWKTYYENGQLQTEGKMNNGEQIEQWNTYNQNGQLESQVTYNTDNTFLINNFWDSTGNQLILNGNGRYKIFADNGTIILEGDVTNGNRTGIWNSYYSNGKLSEEGIYENTQYKVRNNWDTAGIQKVVNGNGNYISYYADGKAMYEIGEIKNGLREGVWKLFYQTPDTLFLEQTYKNGKLNGPQKSYYESGTLYTSSEMIDGIKEGVCTWYHPNGTISSTVTYHKDKKDGLQKLWSELGVLTKEEIYKNGELLEEKDI
jgi:antitoxin component YwqK of YwqJK toxin-antitoxin module